MSENDGKPRNVFLALPNYGSIEFGAMDAALNAAFGGGGVNAYLWRESGSLLATNFNKCLARCVNMGEFEFFAMLHADIGCDKGWMPTIIEEMDAGGFDVMHVPTSIKNQDGLTSTALAYSDREWDVPRRLTLRELGQLPDTFDVDGVNEALSTDATHLLPNTGCMVLRIGDWIREFPGFQILDRLEVDENGVYEANVVPEDWHFGFWCGQQGLRVGGTKKVVTEHWGRTKFPNNKVWGVEIDTHWLDHQRVGA